MIVSWHRPHETIDVDIDNTPEVETFRPYFYEVPVLRTNLSDYLSYSTDGDMAVSLVIGYRSKRPHYAELLVKRAFWFIKNLCERTDVKEQRVLVVLSIDEALKEVALPYALDCNFPTDLINWISFDEDKFRWSCKMKAMTSPLLQGIKRVLHMDLNIHIGTHPTQRPISLFEDIKKCWWDDQVIALEMPLIMPRNWHGYTPIRFMDKYPRVIERITEYMGNSVEEEERYWNESEWVHMIVGRIVGFHRRLMDDPEWQEDYPRALKAGVNDEIATGLYARKHGWRDWDIANLAPCLDWMWDDSCRLYRSAQLLFAHHIQR